MKTRSSEKRDEGAIHGPRWRSCFRTLLLTGSILSTGAGVALAQEVENQQTPIDVIVDDVDANDQNAVDEDVVDEVISVGSRLRNNAFSSDLPIQVFTAEVGELLGVGSTQELVRRSPLLSGSFQSDNQQNGSGLGGLVLDGGNGTNTLSLRGLGAERTLVLLDGKRLSPAGSRGSVSAPNISIIPSSIITRVEILKDGASSIYGSDAVAGIVDNRLVGATDEDFLTGLINLTEDGGAEFFQVSGRWSKTFDRGHLNVAGQVDKFQRLRIGDRDYTDCRDPLLTDPTTGERVDIRDANGETVCTAFGSNNRFFFLRGGTGSFFDPTSINARFSGLYIPDPDGTIVGPGQAELRGIIPEFARVGINNLGRTALSDPFTGPAGGDFEQVAASNALLPQTSPFIQNANAQSPEDRYSVFISGAYDVSDSVEAYGQVLLSRVENEFNSFRFVYEYLGGLHPSNTVAERVRDETGGALFGSVGFNFLRPFDVKVNNNYLNAVAGLRGEFGEGIPVIGGWDWDVYAQHGISDADYTQNFTRQDRFDAVTGFTDVGCDPSLIRTEFLEPGETAQGLCDSIGGAIPFLSPRILRDGQLNDAELAFLDGEETGTTKYKQSIVEGFIGGEIASPLPAGDISLALGFHLQYDELNDQPGPNSVGGNNSNVFNSQPTNGDSALREVFGEIGIPLLEGTPGAERLYVTASGRFTDNTRVSDGGAFTYKVGAAWSPVNALKLRFNYGTSYRAPALFELFQGGSESFGFGDPCQNLDESLRPAEEIANLTQNCGLFGLGTDFIPTRNIRVINSGNNTGTLRPETSTSLNAGIVIQPEFADLAIAVDYFEIRIEDQIGRVGGQSIINRCLVEQAFSTIDEFNANQFCSLLVDRDADGNLFEVLNGSINIAEQISRGLDYTVQYSRDFGEYTFNFNGTVTHILEDFFNQDRDIFDPVNDDLDRTLFALRPKFTGDFTLSLNKGPFTAFWGTRWIGSSDRLEFELTDPGSGFNTDGSRQFFGAYRFLGPLAPDIRVERYLEHTLSFRYNLDSGFRFNAGIQNLFDEEPPQVGGFGRFPTRVGTSAAGPYDFRGRRYFLRVSKTF